MSHTITEYLDREQIHETDVDHPALAGLSVRGFLISQDKRAVIVIEPK